MKIVIHELGYQMTGAEEMSVAIPARDTIH